MCTSTKYVDKSVLKLLSTQCLSHVLQRKEVCVQRLHWRVFPWQLSSVKSSVWPHSSVESQISLCLALALRPLSWDMPKTKVERSFAREFTYKPFGNFPGLRLIFRALTLLTGLNCSEKLHLDPPPKQPLPSGSGAAAASCLSWILCLYITCASIFFLVIYKW